MGSILRWRIFKKMLEIDISRNSQKIWMFWRLIFWGGLGVQKMPCWLRLLVCGLVADWLLVYWATHQRIMLFPLLISLLFPLLFSDKRVADWPLMQSYAPTWALTCLYLFAVWAGPKLMAKREPFQLKHSLVLYNFALIALNFHIFYEVRRNNLWFLYPFPPFHGAWV